jgi:dihydropteroate synthase
MGILNVTPDSFFDGGTYTTVEKACAQADKLVRDGADILDIGAESTRPPNIYGSILSLSRSIPAVRLLRAQRWKGE